MLPLEIAEPSGMVRSPSHEGVFWVHSDSGNAPRLHAVDAQGQIVGRADIEGASNVDWEDITAHEGELYIGDIGNNFQVRQDLVVLRIAEPPLSTHEAVRVPVLAHIRFRYPDQSEFPATHPRFDAEALFWARGQLWLLSKHRDDHKTTLYRFPSTLGDEVHELERIRDLDIGGHGHPYGGMVTAADVSEDGRYLAILSYHAAFVFDLEVPSEDILARPLRRIELRAQALQQCESLAWDQDALIITNEARRIFRVEEAAKGEDILYPPRGH
jgi:hypothetical protein